MNMWLPPGYRTNSVGTLAAATRPAKSSSPCPIGQRSSASPWRTSVGVLTLSTVDRGETRGGLSPFAERRALLPRREPHAQVAVTSEQGLRVVRRAHPP